MLERNDKLITSKRALTAAATVLCGIIFVSDTTSEAPQSTSPRTDVPIIHKSNQAREPEEVSTPAEANRVEPIDVQPLANDLAQALAQIRGQFNTAKTILGKHKYGDLNVHGCEGPYAGDHVILGGSDTLIPYPFITYDMDINPHLDTTSVAILPDEEAPMVIATISANPGTSCNDDGLPITFSMASVGGDIDGIELRTSEFCLPHTVADDSGVLLGLYDDAGVTHLADTVERLCVDPDILKNEHGDD